MPKIPAAVKVFKPINTAIKNTVENLKIAQFSSYGLYFQSFYGWFDDLTNGIEDKPYKTYYFSNVKDKGFRQHSPSYVPEECVFSREYLSIPNTRDECKKAAEYLSTIIPKEYVAEILNNGIAAIPPAYEKPKKVIESLIPVDGWDYFEVLGALLIFAQTLKIPVSQPKSNTISVKNNIYMANKETIQQTYPLDYTMLNAKRIVIINYAGTSLITGKRISNNYDSETTRFFINFLSGSSEIHIVLLDPNSSAAIDAVKYKMRPKTLKVELNQIINTNISNLKNHHMIYPDTDLSLYLTDIALPCSFFMCEFEKDQSYRNNIKIDIYLPSFGVYKDAENADKNTNCKQFKIIDDENFSDDKIRQSFVVFEKDNPELYNTYKNIINNILSNSEKQNLNNEN